MVSVVTGQCGTERTQAHPFALTASIFQPAIWFWMVPLITSTRQL